MATTKELNNTQRKELAKLIDRQVGVKIRQYEIDRRAGLRKLISGLESEIQESGAYLSIIENARVIDGMIERLGERIEKLGMTRYSHGPWNFGVARRIAEDYRVREGVDGHPVVAEYMDETQRNIEKANELRHRLLINSWGFGDTAEDILKQLDEGLNF